MPLGKLQCVVLDCSDALGLAQFYQALLGGAVNWSDPRWAVGEDSSTLHTESGLIFLFQRVEDFRAPQWPDSAHPQQFHLDVDVPDLDEAHPQALALGAKLLHVDPRGWRVYADPAGHPFCLLQKWLRGSRITTLMLNRVLTCQKPLPQRALGT